MLDYNRGQERETKSREILSQLLSQQIDRNEQLQAENLELQEEQRRLLNLLQIKIHTIQQLEQHAKGTGNDSTMEITHLQAMHSQANQSLMREYTLLKGRFEALQQAISSKEEETGRLRDYYASVIDKLEADSQKRLAQVAASNDANVRKLIENARAVQTENQNLQQIILKNSEKIRELSQEVIVLEASKEQLTEINALANERRARIIELQKQIESIKSEKEQALLDVKFQFQEREMKRQKEADEKLAKLRKEAEERISQLKKAHQAKLQQIESIKNNDSSELKCLQESEKHLIEEKENLLKEQIFLKRRIDALQSELSVKDQETTRIRQYYTATIDKLEQQSAKKQEQAVESADATVRRLIEDARIAQQENQSLQQIILKHSEKLRELSQELIAYETVNEELTEARTLANQRRAKIIDLERQLQSAKSEREDALLQLKFEFQQKEMRRQKEADDKLAKTRKEAEDKIAHLKKTQEAKLSQMEATMQEIKTQHQQAAITSMDIWQAQKSDMRRRHEEDKQSTSAKIRELAEALGKATEEKERASREQKRFKEELLKVEEKIKQKYLEFEKEMERIRSANADLTSDNNQLIAQRDNYRKLYEGCSSELVKSKERLLKLEQKNQRLIQQLDNYQQETDLLKQEIAQQQLHEKDRDELYRSRQELIELKAKLAYLSQQITRLKQQNANLAKQAVDLNVQRQRQQDQLKKSEKRIPQLEKQVEELKGELEQRCRKMETEMPYINTLIQQKTALQAQLQRSRLENKRKDHLIEVAKRSKAQELIRLQQQAELSKKDHSSLEKQLQEQKIAIEQLNREKVNGVRQAARKDDAIRELENKVKQLKAQHRKALETIKGQQQQIQALYAMVEQFQNIEE